MNKKVIPYLIGGMCVLWIFLGLLLLIPSNAIRITIATVIVCLSIATGMLVPLPAIMNPFSFWGLVVGIGLYFLPGWVMGIVFLLAGAVGAVANYFAFNMIVPLSTENIEAV